MRIVIVGGGQIGSSLARALAAEHEVVVIDHDKAVADSFTNIDAELIVGSGTSEEVLERAGIRDARFFVARTPLDEVNIVACAIANRMASPETICLVSRAEFTLTPRRCRAGAVRHQPRAVAGGAAGGRHRRRGHRARRHRRRVVRGRPDPFARVEARVHVALVTVPLGQLHLPRGSLIVAVKRGGSLFVPRGHTQLAEGDKIILMGTPDALRQVEQLIHPSRSGDSIEVTIIGGGDVGLQLAERLEASPQCRRPHRGTRRGAG